MPAASAQSKSKFSREAAPLPVQKTQAIEKTSSSQLTHSIEKTSNTRWMCRIHSSSVSIKAQNEAVRKVTRMRKPSHRLRGVELAYIRAC
ncbi:hypothetical protein Y032_0046g1301 [Ancylostoma ceylanicum]|nr:hypothetical protein Y032_0046g1301 [Ancylostoma ceylanicum]